MLLLVQGSGGKGNHRDVLILPLPVPEKPGGGEAVHPRHLDVHQNQVYPFLRQYIQRLLPIGGLKDLDIRDKLGHQSSGQEEVDLDVFHNEDHRGDRFRHPCPFLLRQDGGGWGPATCGESSPLPAPSGTSRFKLGP